jgi:hypothetical protein
LSVTTLFQEASFGPDVIQIMSDAFERACRSLRDTGQPEMIKEVIAQRIIVAAREGRRDPRELCEEAMKSLGLASNCE